MSARPNSTKVRRECFDRNKFTDPVSGRVLMTCYLCGLPIDPIRQKWDAEHVVRRVLSNDDGPGNVLPAHVECHKPKTADDIREHSKGVRTRDKHFGIVRKQGFRKVPEGYAYSWKAGRVVKIGEEI